MQGESMQQDTNTMPARKAYAAPTLVRFGALTELTASGTGASNESAGQGADMPCAVGYNFNKNCGKN